MKLRASDYPFHLMDEDQNPEPKVPIYTFDANKVERETLYSLTPQARIHRANLNVIRKAVETDDKRRRNRALELGSHAPKRNWRNSSLVWRFLRRFLP